jgi:hypothetical protein
MIISASRRTDIPAFFGKWFIDSIKKGIIEVKNPYNVNIKKTVSLLPYDVDCIVFWTKNAIPFMKYLPVIDDLGYNYYFLYTITAYNNDIEKNLPAKELIINNFKNLSQNIGNNKLIWRYDPVFFTDVYNDDFHLNQFENLSKQLNDYSNTCITSFLTSYRKCKTKMKNLNIIEKSNIEKANFLKKMIDIANKYNFKLQTCAIDNSINDIVKIAGKCIDNIIINNITGKNFAYQKDKTQRTTCLCHKSIDIGEYRTCKYDCIYCYAK